MKNMVLLYTSLPGQTRKPYQRPQLIDLGDLRSLTLGGSPGLNDSGNPYVAKPIAGSTGSMPVFDPLSGEVVDEFGNPLP